MPAQAKYPAQLAVSLTEKMMQQIKTIADAHHVSYAHVVREAVVAYLLKSKSAS
jgi:hypothetical protein